MLLSFFVAAALAAPPDAEREVRVVFAEIAELTRRQERQDSRTISSLNHAIESLRPRVTNLGAAAVPALGGIAKDPSQTVSMRLWALSFAGLIRDPSAFPWMKQILLDARESPALRADAAADIGLLAIDPHTVGAALCQTLAGPNLDALVFRQVLHDLSTRGCPDAAPLNRWAAHFGSRPSGKDAQYVRWLLSALERSRSASSAKALTELFSYYQPGSWERKKAFEALLALPPELSAYRERALRLQKGVQESEPAAKAAQ